MFERLIFNYLQFSHKKPSAKKNIHISSYDSIKIEGRGTIYADPEEVRLDMERQKLFERAERIINSN